MRGKVEVPRTFCIFIRITPAHAGKRRIIHDLEDDYQDHPRTCGEKISSYAIGHIQLGSPPHMRGKVLRAFLMSMPSRITPAHAGKSSQLYSSNSAIRDHPRTCGEKLDNIMSCTRAEGSPPHMRGKANQNRQAIIKEGITPAHAGKRL